MKFKNSVAVRVLCRAVVCMFPRLLVFFCPHASVLMFLCGVVPPRLRRVRASPCVWSPCVCKTQQILPQCPLPAPAALLQAGGAARSAPGVAALEPHRKNFCMSTYMVDSWMGVSAEAEGDAGRSQLGSPPLQLLAPPK